MFPNNYVWKLKINSSIWKIPNFHIEFQSWPSTILKDGAGASAFYWLICSDRNVSKAGDHCKWHEIHISSNIFSFSIFLICTLLVFGNIQTPNYTIPYIVPILQTALTVSVYSTVCIAVSGALVVRPTPDNNQFDIFQRIKMYLR